MLRAFSTAATGMDALAHCFEALCAPAYHPMADGIALEGMDRHVGIAMRALARECEREIDAAGGLTARLLDFCMIFVGRLRGGLGLVNVLASMVFGGISGSSVSDTASVGAVLIPGAAAPKLISREQLSTMKPGAVLVDVAIDQGGCFETSRATTHSDPIFEVEGIVHYCVANMSGAVPKT